MITILELIRFAATVLLSCAAYAILLCVPVMAVWNWVAVDVLSFDTITILESIGLIFLIGIFKT